MMLIRAIMGKKQQGQQEPSSTGQSTHSNGGNTGQMSSNVSSTSAVPAYDNSARLGTYSVDQDLQKPFKELYAIAQVIGCGSFSTVRYGYDRQHGTPVAVKLIKKHRLDPKDLEGLKSEIEILKELNHENVIKLYGFYQDRVYYYIVTEFVPGGSLFDRIVSDMKDKPSSFSEADARRFVRTIGQALKYCHDRGVVHRDLKPENILLSSQGSDAQIKLADFGFAKKLQVDMMGRSINSLRTALGTPGYVAPEVIQGKIYGKPVDMWSLGVIIYIMLCGYPPFYSENDDDRELFALIKRAEYDFDSEYWDQISTGAKDLVSKLLELDMDKRLTVDQLLQHPWVAASGESQGADITPALVQLQKFQDRSRWTVGKLAAVVNSSMTFGELLVRRQQEEAAARAQERPSSNRSSLGGIAQQRPKSLTENPIIPILEEARTAALDSSIRPRVKSAAASSRRMNPAVTVEETIAEGDESEDAPTVPDTDVAALAGLTSADGERSRSSSLASSRSSRSLFRAFSKSSMRKLKTEEEQLNLEWASEEAAVQEAQSRARSASNLSHSSARSGATDYSVPVRHPLPPAEPAVLSPPTPIPPHARSSSSDRRSSGILRISLGRRSTASSLSTVNPLASSTAGTILETPATEAVESEAESVDSYSYDPMSPSSLTRAVPSLYATKVPSFVNRHGMVLEEKPKKKAYFTVFLPHVYPEDEFKVDIWASQVMGKPSSHGSGVVQKGKKGPLKIAVGEVVRVRLDCPMDSFHVAYSEDIFEWFGEPDNASFIVSCNASTAPGSYPFRATISSEGQDMGVLLFNVEVREPSSSLDRQRRVPQDIGASLTILPETLSGYHIFISHRPAFHSLAESVKGALLQQGYKVYLRGSSQQQGEYPKEMESVLHGTPIFLPLFTPGPSGEDKKLRQLSSIEAMKVVKQDWVRHELTDALNPEFGDKLIIPIYKDVDIGQEWRHLPKGLEPIKGLNCRSLQDSSFAESIRLINTFIQRVCLSG